MKNILFFLLIFCIAETQAQNYMLTFNGTGASTIVDSVKVENLTQCTDTSLKENSTLNLLPNVGINTFSDAGNVSLNIFPNPTSGACYLSFAAPANGNTTVAIYDALGKRVVQIQYYLSIGQHAFNIQGLSCGVYLLKIQSDKYSSAAKLISYGETQDRIEINEAMATAQSSAKIKDGKNVITMLYHTGEQLKFIGYSGIYKTIFMLVPTQNQTVTFNFIPCTDAVGNHYGVVKIDTVVWMEENLKTTKFQNGTAIAHPNNINTFDTLIAPGYCYPNNDSTLVPVYGLLYNFYAVDSICPNGWHVPSDSAWVKMITFLGGFTVAGGKIKENCSTYWSSPNIGATNESGFTALPAGGRQTGNFYIVGDYEQFWSSTVDVSNCCATMYIIGSSGGNINDSILQKSDGFSIRCIKN